MLLKDKMFPSSNSYVDKYAELRAIASCGSWFTEFQPVRFPNFQNFNQLLFLFLQQGLCFSFTGPLVVVIMDFINSFIAVSFIMILNEHLTIRLIFQKDQNVIQNFNISSVWFELVQVLNDSCIYRVRTGYFGILMNFYGIDADSRCEYRSNVDFVHFVWEHFERFPIRTFAITVLPLDNAPTPLRLEDTRFLYLKHYRAFSDGRWKDRKFAKNVSSSSI